MKNRTDIINKLIAKFDLNDYLEIGVRATNGNFDYINCEFKDGVDPRKNLDIEYNVTSDEFFENHIKKQYDIVFVDGMHTKEQVYLDVLNTIKHLKPNGFIVVHDCKPATEWHTRSYERFLSEKGGWNGDVYKGFIKLKYELKEWHCFTVDENHGCGIITQHEFNTEFKPLDKEYTDITWDYFVENQKELLDLISWDEFINLLY